MPAPEAAEPAASPAPPPAPQTAAALVSEYELGDTSAEPPVETAAPKPAAPAEPASPPPPPAPKFPAHLTRQAERLGIDPADVDSCGSAAELERLVRVGAVAFADRVKEDNRDRRGQEGGQPAPGQPGVPAPAATPPAAADDGAGIGLTDDEAGLIDDNIVKALRHLAGRIGEVRQAAQRLGQIEQQRAVMSTADQLDAAIAKLNRPDLFGAGGRNDLAKDSPELLRRRTLISVMPDGKTFDERVSKAAATLFGLAAGAPAPAAAPKPAAAGGAIGRDPVTGKFTTPAGGGASGSADTRPTREQWESGGLPRPSQRDASELPGESKATQTVARILNETGMYADTAADPDFPE